MIHEQFLTPEFIHMCAETLVSQYMLLTPSDYKKWEEDPEGWANALDSENWEFELRPCAEMTLMTLLSQYRKELVPILLGLIERVATVNDQQGLLFKDAVYGAIGLGVNSLYGVFDFDQFVSTRLVTELEHTNPGFKILRRRIAWMLGKWVNEGVSADCRVIIYEILIKLMREEEDLVVRLTAAHGFKNAIDDWDFDIHIALPYLGNGVHLLLKLLGEIEDSDTIMKMISYLNAILDRTGEHMVGYAAQIVQLLTPIWMSDPEPLLKSSLVATFTKIMANAHVYLLEDGLDLWWTILQTTPSITDSLMSLYPVAIELLDYDTENLRKILKIIESYLLLDPQHCMSLSLPLFTKLGSKIMYCKETASSYITHTVDMVLQVAPLPVYSESLIQSGLLTNVLIVLLQDQLYGYAVMNYMNIFSRLSIYDPLYVIHVIQMTGQQQQVGDFFSQVLDKWMDKVSAE
ncbi:armadillo-type protein [Pilobolus umbonatus]|nr:armadillo-type protein [Pilobolus umbonatus]